jgi:transcriptional regulator with XRE-family HTH domain
MSVVTNGPEFKEYRCQHGVRAVEVIRYQWDMTLLDLRLIEDGVTPVDNQVLDSLVASVTRIVHARSFPLQSAPTRSVLTSSPEADSGRTSARDEAREAPRPRLDIDSIRERLLTHPTLGARLRLIRATLRLTTEVASARINKSADWLVSIEQDQEQPRAADVLDLLLAYGAPYAAVVEGLNQDEVFERHEPGNGGRGGKLRLPAEMIWPDVRPILRRELAKSGLTHDQVADKIGVNPLTLATMLKNSLRVHRDRPSQPVFLRLCLVLGTTPEQIFDAARQERLLQAFQ